MTRWLLTALLMAAMPLGANAQETPSNRGAITLSGGFDAPSVYLFRGILQEGDPKITLWPHGDLNVALRRGDHVWPLTVNVGLWNSLHTGTSGTGGPERKLHYEGEFHTGVTVGIASGLIARSTFVVSTSPNGSFDTIKEMDIQVKHTDWIAPYGLVAFELSDTGQRDGGEQKGTYVEIGAEPRLELPFAGLVLTVPVKAGFSLKDYYELFGSDLEFHDNRFGFFDVGGLVTFPLSSAGSRFGSWNIHGGVDWLRLGTTTQAFNKGEKTRVVGLVGAAFTY